MRICTQFGILSFAFLLGLQTSAFSNNHEKYPASQGWSQNQMEDWYELSQGSRLIPMKWLEALKKPDGNLIFNRSALEGFGYTYFSKQPDALPVGFIIDRNGPQSWLGFNCAACHTSKLKTSTAEVIIHGGQTMADFQSFTTSLISAVQNVAADGQAFDDFSKDAIGANASAKQKTILKSEMVDWLALRKTINDTGSDSHWGRGRADAVGIILATTASVVADPKIPVEEREPFPASNAPVSYPFVWNANQQARLQHNGVVDNGVNLGVVKVAKLGALIRNWTEALGVFADVKLDAKANKVISSIRLDNLLRIEQALAELQSPRWPESFGKLDETARTRGQVLYKTNCASCHGILNPFDTKTELPLLEQPSLQRDSDPAGFVYLQPIFDKRTKAKDFEKTINPSPEFIGTDPGMACNALTHTVPSGRLEGKKNVVGVLPSLSDRPFSERAVTTDLLRILIQRDILAHKFKSVATITENQLQEVWRRIKVTPLIEISFDFTGQSANDDPLWPLRQQLKYCADYVEIARTFAPETPLPVYKSRPLNGIWATAPYLHNGSVPTLYDLLLPQVERPKNFGYFDGEMDTVRGGLKDATANPAAYQFRTFDEEGSVIVGNWNGGHEYGATLSHADRLDLVEYLKGL